VEHLQLRHARILLEQLDLLQALLAMGLLLLVGLIQSMLGGARGPIGFGWSFK
jgi:hypothetical protein